MADKKYVYTVAVGNFNPLMKASRDAVGFISGLEGIVAVHPHYPNGTLLLFDSKANAKRAKMLMQAKGIHCGTNIGCGWIDGDTLVLEHVEEKTNGNH